MSGTDEKTTTPTGDAGKAPPAAEATEAASDTGLVIGADSEETVEPQVAAATEEEDPVTTPAFPPRWTEKVGAFAKSIGSDLTTVSAALFDLVGEPDDDSVVLFENEKVTPLEDIAKCLKDADVKTPVAKLRHAVLQMRGAPAKQAASPAAALASALPETAPTISLLPPLPEGGDESFLESLRVGGSLKVDELAVVAGVRASLAAREGFFEVPTRLLEAVRVAAEETQEPFTPAFYALSERIEAVINRRSYAAVLSAIGAKGRYVNNKERKRFLDRLDEHFWPAVLRFNGVLDGYYEQLNAQGASMRQLAQVLTKGRAVGQRVDSSPVRRAAEAVFDAANRAYAGPGVEVSRAMAFDAIEVRSLLTDPMMPAACGQPNKELMLKTLGLNKDSQITEMESMVARYCWAIIKLTDLPKGTLQEEQYLEELWGQSRELPFSELRTTSVDASNGDSGRSRKDRYNDPESGGRPARGRY